MTVLTAGDRGYHVVQAWPVLPDGVGWSDVCAVAAGPADRLYALTRGEHPIMVFDPDGSFAGAPDASRFDQVHGLAVLDDGTMLVTDEGAHALVCVGPGGEERWRHAPGPSDTGAARSADIHATVASVVRAAGPFNRPTGVAAAANGDLYVSDGYGNARIHRFSADGRWLDSFGEPGREPGQFRLPHGVHVDRLERLWVADWGNDRLQVFDLAGRLLDVIGGFSGPAGVVVDDDGFVFVAEENWRVSVLGPELEVFARWGDETGPIEERVFVAPHGITLDSRGDLYIGEVASAYRGIERGVRALTKLVRLD